MTALPASTDFTGGSVTEGDFKVAITALRDFLDGLLGADGVPSTALAALGGMAAATIAKTSTYTVVAADRGKLIDCTTGTWSLIGTAAATLGDGFAVAVRNSGSGVITFDPNASELVDAVATITLNPGDSVFLVCNGSAWKSVGKTNVNLQIVPIGTVIDFAGTTAPAGYLKCAIASGGGDQIVSRTTYAALFAVIGTTWGAGDGSTTFGIPWFPANYAVVQANSNVGSNTVGEVIAHTHIVPIGSTSTGAALKASSVATPLSSQSTGGSANLAAGVRMLKCVKY